MTPRQEFLTKLRQATNLTEPEIRRQLVEGLHTFAQQNAIPRSTIAPMPQIAPPSVVETSAELQRTTSQQSSTPSTNTQQGTFVPMYVVFNAGLVLASVNMKV